MGREFYETRSDVRRLYDTADRLLRDNFGWSQSLRDICFEGPEEFLNKTHVTQPALFVADLASYTALKEERVNPSIVSGHSLGMYPAYVAAGALSFKDAFRLVTRRGELMAEAGEANPGKMAAILGLAIEEVEERLKGSGVEVTNHNTPKQIVISGRTEAVEQVLVLFDRRQVRVLNVSIAGHSRLMAEAAENYAVALNSVEFRQPTTAIVLDTTGNIESSVEEIKQAALEQLVSRVLWVDAVTRMIQQGTRIFVEVGPGTVLSGLIKRINPGARTFNVGDEASLERLLSALK